MPDEIVAELKSIRDMSISVLGNCNKFLRKCTGIINHKCADLYDNLADSCFELFFPIVFRKNVSKYLYNGR